MHKSKPEISTNNLILIAVLVSAISLVAAGVVGRSLVDAMLLNDKIINKKNTANEQLKENLRNAETLSDNYNQLGNTSVAAMHALPDRSEFPASTSMLENIAASSGVTLRTVSPSSDNQAEQSGAEAVGSTDVAGAAAAGSEANVTTTTTTQGAASAEAAPAPQKFTFTISIGGTYPAMLEFVRNLELSGRTFKVNSFTIGGSGGMTADVQVSSFWQAPADLELKTEPLQ